MRLASVEHVRCDEPDGRTLVWVDDLMTEQGFEERVSNAERLYLEAVKEFMSQESPRPARMFAGSGPLNVKDPAIQGMTVAEALARHEALQTAEKERSRVATRAMRSFESFLCDEEGVVPFWDGVDAETAFAGEVYWGHRHGTPLDFGKTSVPSFKLLRKTERMVESETKVYRTEEGVEWA
jgi:hypothetical protein